MKATSFIRYQIDPFQRAAFQRYAEAWGHIIPRCGGHLIGYLAKLRDAGLLDCESRARHRYYRLGHPDIAHTLEALALVTERSSHDRNWEHPSRQRLRFARCCYGRLAGELGVRLFETLQAHNGLRPDPNGRALTAQGQTWLLTLGLQAAPPCGRRRFAYPCLDWSERRDHLAGQLADQLLAHLIGQGWGRRGEGRTMLLTPAGEQALLPWLAMPASWSREREFVEFGACFQSVRSCSSG